MKIFIFVGAFIACFYRAAAVGEACRALLDLNLAMTRKFQFFEGEVVNHPIIPFSSPDVAEFASPDDLFLDTVANEDIKLVDLVKVKFLKKSAHFAGRVQLFFQKQIESPTGSTNVDLGSIIASFREGSAGQATVMTLKNHLSRNPRLSCFNYFAGYSYVAVHEIGSVRFVNPTSKVARWLIGSFAIMKPFALRYPEVKALLGDDYEHEFPATYFPHEEAVYSKVSQNVLPAEFLPAAVAAHNKLYLTWPHSPIPGRSAELTLFASPDSSYSRFANSNPSAVGSLERSEGAAGWAISAIRKRFEAFRKAFSGDAVLLISRQRRV